MTVDEKRQKALSYCENMKSCGDCPMRPTKDDDYAEFCAFKTYSEAKLDECLERFRDSKKAEDKTDNVNHPAHYELPGGIECFDVLLATQGAEAAKAFCVCNAIKYLFRHKNKNGTEDIRKAHWYLSKFIELEEA